MQLLIICIVESHLEIAGPSQAILFIFSLLVANFWSTTGLDGDILPTFRQAPDNIPGSVTVSQSSTMSGPPVLETRKRDTGPTSGGFDLSYVMSPENSSIVATPLDKEPLYPRISLAWPLLAITGPFRRLSLGVTASAVTLCRLVSPCQLEHGSRPHLVCQPVTDRASPMGRYRWSAFVSRSASPGFACANQQLATADDNGHIVLWDLDRGGQIVNQFIVRDPDSPSVSLTCCAIPGAYGSARHISRRTGLLVAGLSGRITLWDAESAVSRQPPQLTFTFPGRGHVPIRDLLWLTETRFASVSNLVDRDACEQSVTVWDMRVPTQPLSRQLYQERWGCERMALQPRDSPTLRFAVQTHGNTIFEVYGPALSTGNSSSAKFRLESRWCYQGHDCQAHPLGLAYSPDGRYLASGSQYPTGPVIWSAHHTRRQCGYAPLVASLNTYSQPMTTDVAWIPHSVLRSPSQYSLVAVLKSGAIMVFTERGQLSSTK